MKRCQVPRYFVRGGRSSAALDASTGCRKGSKNSLRCRDIFSANVAAGFAVGLHTNIRPQFSISCGPAESLVRLKLALEFSRWCIRSEEHTSELQSHVNLVC